jgi:formylglycine-generating enzyme required for sulfatase activity
MGSPTTEAGRSGDETQHQVTLSNGFYLGKYEVTQAQYQTVMNGNFEGLSADPSQFKGSNRPVENISWDHAQIFLTRLNSIEQSADRLPNGWKYVLPTEAEWEYACRAGTSTAYSWGNDINSSHANYNWDGSHNTGNDFKQTRPIGLYSANQWGFFDMHGNVWEIVSDWKASYPTGSVTNPEGPARGTKKIWRGASWWQGPSKVRSASRSEYVPSFVFSTIGFRVAFKTIQPDIVNPELEISGEFITHEAGQSWTESGVEAHDVRDGNITSSVTVTGTVDVNATGTYVLNYSVADAAGNTDSATRTVTVVDTTNPVLTLLGDANMTHAKNTAWLDPGATASDSHDGNLTSSISVTGTVDVNVTGVYTLTYSVSDGASNESNATRTVNVRKAHSVDLNASVKLDMLWVEPGTFMMGSPTTEAGRKADREDEHNVTLTKGFYLGKYEVTQAQYEAVMTGNTDSLSATPSEWPNNPNRPVEKVSWADAQIFLTRLNAQQSANIPAGWAYVLPTESQWEYACRAGTNTAYSWGNSIASTNANYDNIIGQTCDVGSYAANPWGFFDMHGNVREWTADWYQAAYPTGNPVVDPSGPVSGSTRVRRGGFWGLDGANLRSAWRSHHTPSLRNSNIGFRVAYQFTGEHTADLNATVQLDMLWVEPGTFTMGSPTTEAGRGTDETEYNVTLTQGFYLGKYEVTQAQYEAVMTGNTDSLSTTPSEWPNNPNRPVDKVSWEDTQVFLSRLNAQQSANIPAGWAYVLPTESQWEYASRAGTNTMYSWGDDINSTRSNYNTSGLYKTRDVGYYDANPWGFFDMHGNVWEWTADWYQQAYPNGNPVVDPTGPASGSGRVQRGGSWGGNWADLRSARRYLNSPNFRSNSLGFRVGFQFIGEHSVDLNASVKLDMLWVEPGTFTMGSPTTEAGRQADREDEHNVTLTKGFYLGKYEVTQAQYEAVMTGNGDGLSATPSEWPNNTNRPVEKVSWADAQIFLTCLNAQQSANIPSGWAYVLPTESQWEYACRAGTTLMYSWGATIASSDANWNHGSDANQTENVGQYAANPWGFFDMHGNVWEWTADWYQVAYPSGNPVVDPTGPASGSSRVRRGGSWLNNGADLRSAERFGGTPSLRTNSIGFRVGFQEQ